MLDRYGIIDGSIETKSLEIIAPLPNELSDEIRLKEKLLNDNKKLLAVVNYFKSSECRRIYVSEYFGFYDEPNCGNCDVCN